ncbi:hypothetical protein AWC38_SpisGene6672 [Stylophora pistillata]|uniref:Uncharacterized protein n=1 Tax=Stylophora pistillata TaxID=50429 RepID=A0A2B4SD36_STYPI|nr:hypothetical protein AWC38_SpisGene6672 [Stylophora pistillata]
MDNLIEVLDNHLNGLPTPCNMKTLTYADVCHLTATPGPACALEELNFGNINNNSDVHGGNKAAYSYNIDCSVDLAKLYLANYLAEFSAFEKSMDLCAALKLFGSRKYPIQIFVSSNHLHNIQSLAHNVREAIEALVQCLPLNTAKKKELLDHLSEWKAKGFQLILDEEVKDLMEQFQNNKPTRDEIEKIIEKHTSLNRNFLSARFNVVLSELQAPMRLANNSDMKANTLNQESSKSAHPMGLSVSLTEATSKSKETREMKLKRKRIRTPTASLELKLPSNSSTGSHVGAYTLCSLSFETGRFSKAWKEALVLPSLKKPGLDFSLKNFRPVSNLSYISKLSERAAAEQFMEHLTANNLHSLLQSADKQQHSTETTLLKVKNDILMSMDDQHVTLLLLLDLSAAFDTIHLDKLIDCLKSDLGISDIALAWFKSLLNAIFHKFADDTQLYVSFSPNRSVDPDFAIKSMTDCINDIRSWMISDNLMLNDYKTEFLIIGTRQQLAKDRTGKLAWNYVLVQRALLFLFMRRAKGSSLEVTAFEKVLKSGWGMDPPVRVREEIREIEKTFPDMQGVTILHFAYKSASRETVNELVVKGKAHINTCDGEGYSPLHLAAMYGTSQVVKKLVELNADVNLKVDGRDAADLAAYEGRNKN